MSDAVAPPHRAVSNLPSRDTGFVGRQTELASLRARLRETGRAVISGPPGVGRTALSLEYAHRSADDYDGIWLLAADRPELVGGQLAQAAYAAGLADPDVTDPAALEALAEAIAGGARWLLILDDLASEPWFPAGAHIIITAASPAAGTGETDPARASAGTTDSTRTSDQAHASGPAFDPARTSVTATDRTPSSAGATHPTRTSAATTDPARASGPATDPTPISAGVTEPTPTSPAAPDSSAVASDRGTAASGAHSAVAVSAVIVLPSLRPEETASLLRQRLPGP